MGRFFSKTLQARMERHNTFKGIKGRKCPAKNTLPSKVIIHIWKWKKVKSLSHARLFVTPWIVACTKLLRPWDFQGKSAGVSCQFLLQEIFPTQGSNSGLSHCRQMLYCLSHQERWIVLQTKQKLKEFITTKSGLQETLKENR